VIEFDLLMHLIMNEGKVMSRDKILETVWMDEVLVIDRVVDVHINSLRKKLSTASPMIETVRGIGYKFRP
jgi:DNA-binding response OmpR family regulator